MHPVRTVIMTDNDQRRWHRGNFRCSCWKGGIDYKGAIPEDLIGTMEVPETSLNEQDLQQFLDAIDTDTRFEDWELSTMCTAKSY